MNHKKIIVRIDSDLQTIVPEYLEKRRDEIPIYWKALQTHDFAKIQSLAHRLKGSAGGYGFRDLGVLAAKLEIGAEKSDLIQLQSLVTELQEYIGNIEVVFGATA